jgi:hypothetical protein
MPASAIARDSQLRTRVPATPNWMPSHILAQ